MIADAGSNSFTRLIDLSGLVHNLNVVTVGVEYPGCVIVRMILELGRRCSFLPSACCNCSYKEGIHLRMAFGDKTEVNGIRIGPPNQKKKRPLFPKPCLGDHPGLYSPENL